MTTASVIPAVKAAAEDLLLKLKRCASNDKKSPLHGLNVNDIVAEYGSLRAKAAGRAGKQSLGYGELLRLCNLPMIEALASVSPGPELDKYSLQSFGVQFSEVRIDGDTGEVRVTRHVAVFDIGRVSSMQRQPAARPLAESPWESAWLCWNTRSMTASTDGP